MVFAQTGNQTVQSLRTTFAPHDQFRNHRIVVNGHLVALPNARLNANIFIRVGCAQMMQRSGAR